MTMSTRQWDAEAEEAASRDPRQAPFGIYTGDSFVLASVRVFLWFESIEQLMEHLLEVEPRRYRVTPGNGLEEYQARVRPILERLRYEGLAAQLLDELNPAQDGGFVVDWWGTFAELRDGDSAFAAELRERFYLKMSRAGKPIEGIEDEFVDFVWNYGV